MTTVLVTGGAGFIGSNLVRYLLSNTESTVVNIDALTYAGNLESLTDIADDPRYHFVRANICDADAVRQAFETYRPEAVIHLAAESHVDRSIDSPGEFIETNIVGTYRLLQGARAHFDSLPEADRKRFRFHHVSTDEVYGSSDLDEPGFEESTRYDPRSPYSASKASSDHLVRAWHETYGLPVLISNCSNNYGPYQFPEKLVPVVILNGIHGRAIPIFGNGQNVRDWLHVDDHVQALWTVLTRGEVGQSYNVGGNNEWSNLDLATMLCQMMDELIPVEHNSRLAESSNPSIGSYCELITFVSDRPGHDFRYSIDASKIRDELGWQATGDKHNGFRKTIQWYLDNPQWWQRVMSGAYRR